MNRDDFFLLEGQCRPACVPACTYVRKALRRGVCICQRTKSVCACNVQVIEVAKALLLLHTEKTLIWQKKKGFWWKQGYLIHASCLTTVMKTGLEEEIWARKLHKLLNWYVSEQNNGNRGLFCYTYSSITLSYLKISQMWPSKNCGHKERDKYFVNLKAMDWWCWRLLNKALRHSMLSCKLLG